MKPEVMVSGCMAESEAFSEPVVMAVVTTVQKLEKNPPILTSMPGPKRRCWNKCDKEVYREQRVRPDEYGSRLPALSQQLAENEDQGCREKHHQEHLENVREGAGVLEGIGGIGSVVSSTVCSDLHY